MINNFLYKIEEIQHRAKNPPFFLYSVFHYLNIEIPVYVAKRLRNKNLEREVHLLTYDGSNQVVHPDCVYFNGEYWIVVTPYPFGMEEYENPSIFHGTDILHLSPIKSNPIERQASHAHGVHLSDPCLYNDSESLYCVYRDTRTLSKTWNGIFYKKIEVKKNPCQSKPVLLLESETDPLLSPAALLTKDNSLHLFHINYKDSKGILLYTKFDKDMNEILQTEIRCDGIPTNYAIWHIGVSFVDLGKYSSEYTKLKGIFLLKNIKKSHDYHLFFASSNKIGDSWEINQEILPPPYISHLEQYPYKSALLPISNEILYAFRDNNNRYRVFLV